MADEIKKVAPSLSFFCISQENDKVSIFASVSEDGQARGLKANEWVSYVLGNCGGKGGGKGDFAQGSIADLSKLDHARSLSKEHSKWSHVIKMYEL